MSELLERGISAVFSEIRTRIGDRPVYLSYDMDFFDPSVAPGVCTPTWGGATSREGLAVLEACAGLNLVGVNINTVSPPHDVGGMSALLAAQVTLNALNLPVLVTLSLVVAMFTAGSLHYPYFGTGQVFLNLFVDNSFLLVAVVGMTFVILTGGIDLSVGSVVALSTLLCAELAGHGWPAYAVVPVVLLVGATLGLAMGSIIHFFEIQPFIVTLAGMFLARGLCYAITVDAISITDPSFTRIAGYSFALPWELLTAQSRCRMRSWNRFDGSLIPFDSSRPTNDGRTPVDSNWPNARPF